MAMVEKQATYTERVEKNESFIICDNCPREVDPAADTEKTGEFDFCSGCMAEFNFKYDKPNETVIRDWWDESPETRLRALKLNHRVGACLNILTTAGLIVYSGIFPRSAFFTVVLLLIPIGSYLFVNIEIPDYRTNGGGNGTR
jgi:hypothetical protein